MDLAGGFKVFGATPEQERLLKGRERFIEDYCRQKGWNLNELTMPQLLEIRKQEGWKNPKAARGGQ